MKHILAPLPVLLASLLAPLAAPTASAQSWMSEFPAGVQAQPSLAVSDQGLVAVTKPMGSLRTAVSILDAEGSELVSFSVRPRSDGTSVEINDAMFLGEGRLVLCGAADDKPYIAAYHVLTGHVVWENSLTGEGSLNGLDRNSLGHIVAHGTTTENGINETLLCAVTNTGGGFHYFRSYNPGSAENVAHDVVCLENGDMYFVIGFDGRFMVTRLTDWGHEIWSKEYIMPGGSIQSAKADVAINGHLIIGYVFEAAGETFYGATRLHTDGDIFWGKRYPIADMGDEPAKLNAVVAALDGGHWMGVTTKVSASDNWRSPGLFKVNASGFAQWGQNLGINQHEDAPHLERLSDGGIAGVYKRNFQGVRVFKANDMGEIGPCYYGDFNVATGTKSMIAIDSAYTYEAFPGGIGTRDTFFSIETTEIENVCRENGSIELPSAIPQKSTRVGNPPV